MCHDFGYVDLGMDKRIMIPLCAFLASGTTGKSSSIMTRRWGEMTLSFSLFGCALTEAKSSFLSAFPHSHHCRVDQTPAARLGKQQTSGLPNSRPSKDTGLDQ